MCDNCGCSEPEEKKDECCNGKEPDCCVPEKDADECCDSKKEGCCG